MEEKRYSSNDIFEYFKKKCNWLVTVGYITKAKKLVIRFWKLER